MSTLKDALPSTHNRIKLSYSELIGLAFVFTEFVDNTPTTAHDEAQMNIDLVKIGLAIAQYREHYGEYSPRLSDLTPNYIDDISKDVFGNNADLHYSRNRDGYLLYSVGYNGRDDGGRTFVDKSAASDAGDWDDLVLCVKR